MIRNIEKLTKSKFVRNVTIVATGTAGAQAITMAFAPVITRLYGPEAFGLQGTFMAILAVLTPIAALAYPIAIVLPKSDQDALRLANLCAFLALGMAILSAIIILIFGSSIASILSIQSVEGFLLLIPVAMLFAAFYQILQQWLIRKKQFKTIAKFAVIQSITLNSAKAGIGWFNPVGAVLIILSTLGNAIHALLLWLGMRKQSAAMAHVELDEQAFSVKELAKRYRDFPIYRAPQALLNAISQSLPVLMLASFIGPAAAGFYALSKVVIGMPISILSKSVGDVFYPRISDAANNQEDIYRLILKSTGLLALAGFIPFCILFLYGEWLFDFVFGAEWSTAGEYASWMSIWVFMGFINRPSVIALPVLGLLKQFFYYEIFSLSLRFFLMLAGFVCYDSGLVAVMLFSIGGFISNFFLVLFVLRKAK